PHAARLGRDVGDDLVAADVLPVVLQLARVLPAPAARIEAVGAARVGRVEHRQAFRAAGVGQAPDHLERGPALLAAGIAPALDRLEDRRGRLADEVVAHVDDHERGALAEAHVGAVAGGAQHFAVARGQILGPEVFAHARLLSCASALRWDTCQGQARRSARSTRKKRSVPPTPSSRMAANTRTVWNMLCEDRMTYPSPSCEATNSP